MIFGGYSIKMSRTGKWNETTRKFGSMGRVVKYEAIRGQRKAARKLMKIVKGHLRDQDLPWPKLSPSTVKRKGHSSALLDTYTYYNSISMWQSNNVIHVGVKKGINYRNGTSVSSVAILHEISTSPRLPRRELWGPSYVEMGEAKGIREIIARHIAIKLNRHFLGTAVKVSYKTFL